MVPLVDPCDLRKVSPCHRARRAPARPGLRGDEALPREGLGPLRLAVSLGSRLRGLLARDSGGEVLLLAPCRDVHTFGMRHAIDVAFVDAAGVVREAHREVPPGRRLRCRAAMVAFERLSGEGPWFREGDRIEVAVIKATP